MHTHTQTNTNQQTDKQTTQPIVLFTSVDNFYVLDFVKKDKLSEEDYLPSLNITHHFQIYSELVNKQPSGKAIERQKVAMKYWFTVPVLAF